MFYHWTPADQDCNQGTENEVVRVYAAHMGIEQEFKRVRAREFERLYYTSSIVQKRSRAWVSE
jgi:hypothetical protein